MSSAEPLSDSHRSRAPARHCGELLRKGPTPEELLALLSRTGERLSRRLSGALAPLLGGEAPPTSAGTARETDWGQLRGSIARLAANSLLTIAADPLTGEGGLPLLVSIEAEPVLRIVDRAFGGKGDAPAPLPTQFPMAAEMMVGRLETMIGGHLSAAVAAICAMPGMPPGPRNTHLGHDGGPLAIDPLRRDGSLVALAPFHDGQQLVQLNLEVDDGGVLPWLITLAMPIGTLARLFGYPDPTPGVIPSPARRAPARADTMPFADVPLSLSAVVIDMRIPFAVIAGLEVGQVLPVAVSRQVPLRIGGATIAHGIVGAVDDRVAVQITRAYE